MNGQFVISIILTYTCGTSIQSWYPHMCSKEWSVPSIWKNHSINSLCTKYIKTNKSRIKTEALIQDFAKTIVVRNWMILTQEKIVCAKKQILSKTESVNAHFFPTREAPEIFSNNSYGPVSVVHLVFPSWVPLLLDFKFVELFLSVDPSPFGFLIGNWENRDSATMYVTPVNLSLTCQCFYNMMRFRAAMCPTKPSIMNYSSAKIYHKPLNTTVPLNCKFRTKDRN